MKHEEISQKAIDANFRICGLAKEDKARYISCIRQVAKECFEAGLKSRKR